MAASPQQVIAKAAKCKESEVLSVRETAGGEVIGVTARGQKLSVKGKTVTFLAGPGFVAEGVVEVAEAPAEPQPAEDLPPLEAKEEEPAELPAEEEAEAGKKK